ncbi:MAG: hypothetical protein ACRD1Q_01410, partial [Vicinamibacterales bacterium]
AAPRVSLRGGRDGTLCVSPVLAVRHRIDPPRVAGPDRRLYSVAWGDVRAAQAAFLSELFGSRVRYSGASLGAQLASVLAGGLSPFIATGLLRQYGSGGPLALYVIAMALITIVSVLFATETMHDEI